jgi:cysteinyl-tRNA synthetase
MLDRDLYLFNSLNSKKELFTPIDPNHITMYVCGPTIYSSPHLGNARSTVTYDLLYRLLNYLYPKVTYVRNITDVDDKINLAAIKRKITIKELTSKILQEFCKDMQELNNLSPDVEPRVLDHLEGIILMIQKLIDNGFAYVSAGHVLFSVKKYPAYGKLSGRNIKDLIAGSRIEVLSCKKNPEDFVLWKPAKETDDASSIFSSPWSKGRPGWHIECSVMSTKFLGENFDIHGGGVDLKFPHHENEIAQSCCANLGSNYAKYWVHNGFLTVNGEKMSKSLGNFITVRELLDKGASGRALRYILLSSHYRKPLDYNQKVFEDSSKILAKFDNMLADFDSSLLADTQLPEDFLACLLDDMNISKAFAYMFSLSKHNNLINKKLLAKTLDFLGLYKEPIESIVPDHITELAHKIALARKNKKYDQADLLRAELINAGFVINYDKSGKVIVKPQ